MANRHFAKLADVWKHLPLAEIVAIERPRHFWESHAGSATYAVVDDAERRYGALTFVDVAAGQPALAGSRFNEHLRSMNRPSESLTSYPGSPRLAMMELGSDCSYLFCDIDVASAADLNASATELGLDSHVRVVAADGMGTLHDALVAIGDTAGVLAHVDPYDPRAPGPSGLSALDLARELIVDGAALVYWYGYDQPERRAWAFDELCAETSRPLWCGDMLVRSSTEPSIRGDGDLGLATTPGTGFGVVCANVSEHALARCQELGGALSAAYLGAPLPDGTPGLLDFVTRAAG